MRAVTRIPTDRSVCLTIDDGPNPETTPMLLSVLDHFGAKATFFVLGRSVEAHPDLAAQIVAAGHELASHGYSHRSFQKLTADELREELNRSEEVFARFRPTPTPYILRPPYGHCDDTVLQTVRSWRADALVTMWSITPCEWRYMPKCRTPAQVLEHCRQRFEAIDKLWNKAILLMHDWASSGDDPNLTYGTFAPMVCASVMERYLAAAQSKGLKTVRIGDCDWSGHFRDRAEAAPDGQ
jgi:peptidoglycan/xylan/chitin deacetylase (PgdA/CDA1 family)